MSRLIGIRHRIKFTKDGEAVPTQIAIWENGQFIVYELSDETSELDWVLGKHPVSFKDVEPDEDLEQYPEHHVVTKGKKTKVPAEYDGLKRGDTVLMVMGGSGDYLANAISRQCDKIKANIIRVTPDDLKQFRGEDKSQDARVLIDLFQKNPLVFVPVTPRDQDMMKLAILYHDFMDIMKERIACGQRVDQRTIGRIFCSESGGYPEGGIKKQAEAAKANSKVHEALVREETEAEKAMLNQLKTMPIWTDLLSKVEGLGPRIGARLIVAIYTIHRFKDSTRPDGKITEGKAKLKSYCCACPGEDGELRRKRSGEVANWSNDAKLALYLLTDQFNRRPNSVWGEKLLEIKAQQKMSHPVVVCKTCSHDGQEVPFTPECEKKKHKRKYNDGHLLKRARQRAGTKFVEWLYKEWNRLERDENCQGLKQVA